MNWLLYILFNFILYSFLGWLIEEVYSYFILGYFKKEGFLSVPLKPMYGIAMCVLIYCYDKLKLDSISLPLLFLIVPTIVEYCTGYLLKKLFKKEYWNYCSLKYNFQGLICFNFSLCWAILTAIAVIFIQPIIRFSFLQAMYLLGLISVIAFLLMALDSTITIIEGIKNSSDNKRVL
jgi:uncharacterized membrane protein